MLFRSQAVEEQSTRLFGEISLAQPLSLKITIALILLVVISVSFFLFNAEYTRKETVRGFLRPDKGLIKVYSHRGGIVEKLFVTEGDSLGQGMPIARIVIPNTSVSGEALSDRITQELQLQIKLLSDEVEQNKEIELQHSDHLRQKLRQTKKAFDNTVLQRELLKQKSELLVGQSEQLASLNSRGYISTLEYQKSLEQKLDVERALESLKALEIQHEGELDQLHFELKAAPEKYISRNRTLRRQISVVQQSLSQSESESVYLVTASHAGLVSSVHFVEGESLETGRPLLTLMPKDSELIGVLLFPTRSAGLIDVGDSAHIRFEAFPHQRFGSLIGRINKVDQTLVTQNEVNFPIPLREPVYRIQAALRNQHIDAYGQQFRLKSGMLFEADITLEKRSLLHWLLDPIYSLRGRML